MSIGIKVEKKSASKMHELIKASALLDTTYEPANYEKFVYFPVNSELASKQKTVLKKILAKYRNAKFVSRKFKKRQARPRNLREALEHKLNEKEKAALVSSFDTIGNIAVIEIPDELSKREKLIAKTLLEINPQIETVCKIASAHKGKYRVQAIKVIAGKRQKTAVYKEYGCTFKIDLEKVFFSPRLSRERIRIAQLIKLDENVGVFFAGVGPFAIIFAKNSKAKGIVGIELNPAACKNFLENIRINKVQDRVTCIQEDVNMVVPKLFANAFDRVAMPLPKGGEDFLETAINSIKPAGGVIHFYQFVPINNKWEEVTKRIEAACKKVGRKFKILRKEEVRSYSPKTVQVVIDIEIRQM